MAHKKLVIQDGIAVLCVDNPPVNAGTAAQRGDIARSLGEVRNLSEIKGVIILSAGRHFYGGSDLREFDHEITEPSLPRVIEAIEALDIPVVAAISGAAFGGGLELALACDLRIADESARLGFPEITLGMIPGAGGTVRSALLIGSLRAAELVVTGEIVDAPRANAIGLIDYLCSGDEDLLSTAIIKIQDLAGRRTRVIDRPWPQVGNDEEHLIERLATGKVRPNVTAAIDLVKQARKLMDTGASLAAERRLFLELAGSKEAKNLRYLFFAKKAASQKLRALPRPKLNVVGIAGAGTMGLALGQALIAAGVEVYIYDPSALARDRVRSTIPQAIIVDDLASLAAVELLIDAVFEDLDVKLELLRSVEPLLTRECVLATNTSYLNLDALASPLKFPERLVGLHFFNPPNRNPLVEIIESSNTDTRTLGAAVQLSTILGKTMIPAGQGDGFLANRVYAEYRNQSEILVEEGATPRSVDQAMENLGLPIGPFAVADMSGLDIAWSRRQRLASSRPRAQRYVQIPDVLCESGRLGKKVGAGWYDYPNGARRGEDSRAVAEIISNARIKAGIVGREISESEIQSRIVASIVCIATTLVKSGIAERSSDIDVALTEGFAFPKWLGGPLRFAASQPESKMISDLAMAYISCPSTYEIARPAIDGQMPAEIDSLLRSVMSEREVRHSSS